MPQTDGAHNILIYIIFFINPEIFLAAQDPQKGTYIPIYVEKCNLIL